MLARRHAALAALALPVVTGLCAPAAGAVTRPATPAPTHAPAAAKYTNWAGYQFAVAKPTSARATWRVPAVSWQGRNGYSNQWVGIGGGTTKLGQLIQAGTESDSVCLKATRGVCTASRSSYYLWLETYPQQAQERVTNLRISPGNIVDVEVRYRATDATALFTLCNLSTRQCVTASRPSAPPRGVAEFVVERPTDSSGRQLALARFAPASFSSMQVKSQGMASNQSLPLAGLPATRITMYAGHVLALPGPLSKLGTSFSTSFVRPA